MTNFSSQNGFWRASFSAQTFVVENMTNYLIFTSEKIDRKYVIGHVSYGYEARAVRSSMQFTTWVRNQKRQSQKHTFVKHIQSLVVNTHFRGTHLFN